MKILLIHCHYRLPGGEDAVFAAERALLEQHGHTVVVYERSNEEAAHGAAKALLPFRAVWNRRAARDVRNIIEQQHIDAVHIHNTLLLGILTVILAMPLASNANMMTLEFGGDQDLSAAGVFITTIASIFTIPAIMWLLFAR